MTDGPLTLRVQRVDTPNPELLVLTVYGGGARHALLFRADGRRVSFGCSAHRPRGASATGLTRHLRKGLVGAVVRELRVDDGQLELRLGRGDGVVRLSVEPGPASRRFRILGDDARAAMGDGTATAARLHPHEMISEASVERGAGLLAAQGEEQDRARERDLRRALRAKVKRLRRKIAAIESDLARIERATEARADAQLILGVLHGIEPDAEWVVATDYSLDPPAERRVRIDRRLGAQAQAEALFRRAKRMERGRPIAEQRLAAALAELERLIAAGRALEAGDARPAQASVDAAKAATPARAAAGRATRLPYRKYLGTGERPILVGRGARDNDTLTLRHARPWDLWLHARGLEGAHVIVPLERGRPCPPELLLDAATLAAHHSRGRGDETVEVQYVERRHVRKPRGLPAGAVHVEREKVLLLRVEPARLRRLLQSAND